MRGSSLSSQMPFSRCCFQQCMFSQLAGSKTGTHLAVRHPPCCWAPTFLLAPQHPAVCQVEGTKALCPYAQPARAWLHLFQMSTHLQQAQMKLCRQPYEGAVPWPGLEPGCPPGCALALPGACCHATGEPRAVRHAGAAPRKTAWIWSKRAGLNSTEGARARSAGGNSLLVLPRPWEQEGRSGARCQGCA